MIEPNKFLPHTKIFHHPAEILKEEFLIPANISIEELAAAMKLSVSDVERFVNNPDNLTCEMALRLSVIFGTTVDMWMNFQISYQLAILRTFHFTATDAKEIDTSEETALIRKKIEKARE